MKPKIIEKDFIVSGEVCYKKDPFLTFHLMSYTLKKPKAAFPVANKPIAHIKINPP